MQSTVCLIMSAWLTRVLSSLLSSLGSAATEELLCSLEVLSSCTAAVSQLWSLAAASHSLNTLSDLLLTRETGHLGRQGQDVCMPGAKRSQLSAQAGLPKLAKWDAFVNVCSGLSGK